MNSNQWDLKEKDNNQISVVGTNVARATTWYDKQTPYDKIDMLRHKLPVLSQNEGIKKVEKMAMMVWVVEKYSLVVYIILGAKLTN